MAAPLIFINLFLFPVVVDVLNVVVILEHIDHLGHVLDIVLVGELDVAILGNHLGLSGEELVNYLFAVVCHAS